MNYYHHDEHLIRTASTSTRMGCVVCVIGSSDCAMCEICVPLLRWWQLWLLRFFRSGGGGIRFDLESSGCKLGAMGSAPHQGQWSGHYKIRPLCPSHLVSDVNRTYAADIPSGRGTVID